MVSRLDVKMTGGLTVKRSTLPRKFFCVPAKRHSIVIIKAIKTVTVGKMPLASNMAMAVCGYYIEALVEVFNHCRSADSLCRY